MKPAFTLRNVAVLPLALLIRAPILLLAYGLIGFGKWLELVGGAIPGLDSAPRKDVFT